MSGTTTRTLADLKDALAAQQAVAPAGGVAPVLSDRPKVEPKRDALGRSYATGRRKNAIARVWIRPGKGARRWYSISPARCCGCCSLSRSW